MGKRQQNFEKKSRSNNYQHGHRYSRDGQPSFAYGSWQSMKVRVQTTRKCNGYYFGMETEPDWNDFEKFLIDVGEPPDRSYTLDRKDTTKGYIRGNVRWSTVREQARNKKNNINVDGMCLKDWSENLGFNYKSVHRWVKQGFSFEDIKKKGTALWVKEQNKSL